MTRVLQRLPDASARFQAFIADVTQKNEQGLLLFDWDPNKPNSFNCFTYAGQALDALFGVNPYDVLGLNAIYTTPDEAYVALMDRGYDSIIDVMEPLFTRSNPRGVQQGDLVFIRSAFGERPITPQAQIALRYTLGIADPPFFWVISTKYGLSKGPLGPHITVAYSTTTMTLPDVVQ